MNFVRQIVFGFCLVGFMEGAFAQTTVTTTGGTANTVPMFSGNSTLVNSNITQAGGNVGIGTTNPLSPLSVSGQVVIGNPYRGDASLQIEGAYGCCGRLTQLAPNGPGQNALNIMASSDVNGNPTWYSWGVNNGAWTINPGLSFGNAFAINSSGNVGIGTTSPNSPLDVNGQIVIEQKNFGGPAGLLIEGNTVGYNYPSMGFSLVNSSGSNIIAGGFSGVITNATAGSESMAVSLATMNSGSLLQDLYINPAGNVGIGTVSPDMGILQIAAPDKTVESAIAIRQSNSPAFGFDLALDQKVNGMGYIYGVAGNTKTALEQFDRINNYVLFNGGNVGIGTTGPGYKLDVAGQIHTSGSIVYADGSTQSMAWTGSLCGGDYAESIDVSDDRRNYEPGDVLVIDPDVDGKFLKSSEPYSMGVAGVYSTKPGVIGRRQTTPKSADEIPMAVIGIVPVKVSAENGPIHRGDILVTSSTPGYAMRGTDRTRMFQAVVGKAMSALASGTGLIEVLVSLQ